MLSTKFGPQCTTYLLYKLQQLTLSPYEVFATYSLKLVSPGMLSVSVYVDHEKTLRKVYINDYTVVELNIRRGT